ncbi:hypothetical protein PYCCODRAFT_1472805 [Trametes coccinea BRFM310]|uniref:BCS1 N-terminal domain-containing protein n=1 Tax=Trametes coccinea (strain BRFM310) TaxID=1353009 RepID=A0A1Y2I705_TRAC3|nr:hypothetical protein PYCCODRAFT_1472805 [Trametes coccinea BRFM310]
MPSLSSHLVNLFSMTAHISAEDEPIDWIMLWLPRHPEWRCSLDSEMVTRTTVAGFSSRSANNSFSNDGNDGDDGVPGGMQT